MPASTPPANPSDAPGPLDPGDPLSIPATLLGLLQAYSPSGAEAPAVEYLVERMHALGYTQAFRDGAGNAVGVMGDGPQQIVLLGHIDTVPGEIPLRIEESHGDGTAPRPGQVLYGRGAVDAKGPLAAFVDAVAEVGVRPGWQLIVIGAVEEERQSDGARYIRDRYRPNFAIIGEPSGWERVTLAYKGSAWAEVELRLPQAHSAGPGRSAPGTAIELWNAILDACAAYNAGRQRLFDQVSPTLSWFASGEDDFETWARLKIGVRLPPDLPPDAWYALLAGVLEPFAPLQFSMQPTGYAIPAFIAAKNTPLVRALLKGIRLAGGEPGFVLKTGTADLNIVAPAWACPAVAYGPGDSSLDHTPGEHIELGEYDRARRVLVEALIKLCDQ
jgi:[amino group carrier protein]-lysine/ornithine hydrolase